MGINQHRPQTTDHRPRTTDHGPRTTYLLFVNHFLSVTRIAKTDEKIFSNYGVDTTKTVSCEVSDGVEIGTVWQATWTGVPTPQARCVSCHCLFWRQLTQRCRL
jgi:hypothetical protein